MTQTLDPGILNASPYGVRAGGEGARGGECTQATTASEIDSPVPWLMAPVRTRLALMVCGGGQNRFVSEKPWPSGSTHESAPMMRLTSRKAQPRIRDHGNIIPSFGSCGKHSTNRAGHDGARVLTDPSRMSSIPRAPCGHAWVLTLSIISHPSRLTGGECRYTRLGKDRALPRSTCGFRQQSECQQHHQGARRSAREGGRGGGIDRIGVVDCSVHLTKNYVIPV